MLPINVIKYYNVILPVKTQVVLLAVRRSTCFLEASGCNVILIIKSQLLSLVVIVVNILL